MATPIAAPRPIVAIPRPELHLAGRTCLAALAFLGLGALGGATFLVTSPDGSAMQWTVSMLDGSPFTDFFIPGLILGGLFGLGSLAVVVMGMATWRIAPFLAFALGAGQMIWIVVELVIIGQFSFLHPFCFGLGLVIAASAVRWGWPTFDAWRRARARGLR
jgi:hypothetical protein